MNRITFGKLTRHPCVDCKEADIFVGDNKVGYIVKNDDATCYQIKLLSDSEFLLQVNGNHDKWHFLFDDCDCETLAEAKAEVKHTLQGVL